MQEMKYFNEGNDCDICKNQLMTGRDGTVEDCRRSVSDARLLHLIIFFMRKQKLWPDFNPVRVFSFCLSYHIPTAEVHQPL